MSNKYGMPSICRRCEHHCRKYIFFGDDLCNCHGKIINYITGEKENKATIPCVLKNDKGTCEDFEPVYCGP